MIDRFLQAYSTIIHSLKTKRDQNLLSSDHMYQSKWQKLWLKVKQLMKSYYKILKDGNYLLLLSSWALIQGFFQTFLILFVRQVRQSLTENVNINIGYIMLIVFVRNRLHKFFSVQRASPILFWRYVILISHP